MQATLQEVQQQYKETQEMLVKEREAAKKAAEVAPVVKEVPVIDTELMNKLRDENDKLKVRPDHILDSLFCLPHWQGNAFSYFLGLIL